MLAWRTRRRTAKGSDPPQEAMQMRRSNHTETTNEGMSNSADAPGIIHQRTCLSTGGSHAMLTTKPNTLTTGDSSFQCQCSAAKATGYMTASSKMNIANHANGTP